MVNQNLRSITKIIQFLEAVRNAIGLWVGDDFLSVIPFIHGLNACAGIFGILGEHNRIYEDVVKSHNWEWSARLPIDAMKDKGMSNEDIASELLTMEIETWSRQLDNLNGKD